ncbi:MAG: vWA domain-containing protein [Gammaproteobacteria bacterium]
MLLKDIRLWFLALPLTLLVAALLNPRLPLNQDIYDLVFVIDITQSMNAQDYHVEGLPADRLSFVKHSLKEVISNLPCGSRVGLSLFTTKNTFLLFEPLEICEHYTAIVSSLMKIDWRMAWSADSHIARGLYTGLKEADRISSKPSLVFLTDGQQTPATAKEPRFLRETGKNSGMIIGVGNLQPVPIPKFDNNNIQTGYWQVGEAESRSRNRQAAAGNYLTSVQETTLHRLARITGMSYHHLETPARLEQALKKANLQHQQSASYDVRWILVLLALAVYLTPYITSRFPR